MADNIGALWKRKSKKSDVQYLAGIITLDNKEYKISVFKNTKKKSENHPDYNIVLQHQRSNNEAQKDDYGF